MTSFTRKCILALAGLVILLASGCDEEERTSVKKLEEPKSTGLKFKSSGEKKGYGTEPKLSRRKGDTIKLDPDTVVISGCLAKEIVRGVIDSHRDDIKGCFSAGLARNPQLAGKVNVRFTIVHSGSVTKSEVTQTTLNDAQVEKCMTDKILTWKFPSYKGGPECVINYPFILKSK
jgi:hypothetical protein